METSLKPGLYLVSTPIGCLEDISLRALRVLQNCTRILCEDTRITRKLLHAYKIKASLLIYNDYTAETMVPQAIQRIQNGESLALISDAGTPLLSDPGFKLVQACLAQDIYLTTIPGPTAFLSGAQLSGFPLQPLTFLGFASSLKKTELQSWKNVPSTLVFFESPHKMLASLNKIGEMFSNREIAVIREITKLHEEIIRGTFSQILERFSQKKMKGEMVIVLSAPLNEQGKNKEGDKLLQIERDLEQRLTQLFQLYSFKKSVASATLEFSLSKREVYAHALVLAKKLKKTGKKEKKVEHTP
jgi:16S rRNA (cytidine1402-2'-O)-methyltransferase